jgi:hypothetical protein
MEKLKLLPAKLPIFDKITLGRKIAVRPVLGKKDPLHEYLRQFAKHAGRGSQVSGR